MSPEQAAGRVEQLGPASDVYSLGATLYTLLTGRTPVEGGDKAEVLRQVQQGDWQRPRQVKPDVHPALDAVCRKAMARRPEDRYGSALELATDVERWLADEPVAAWPEPWTVRARRWLGRHRTLVTSTVAVVLVTLVGAAAGVLLLAAANERERDAKKVAQDERDEAKRRRDEARLNQYIAQMNLVQREYDANNIPRVRELLDDQIPKGLDAPDWRGFEWHYWHRLSHRERLTLQGHTGVVDAVAFSGDGRRLASASRDGTVKVWEAATGQEALTLQGHAGRVSGVAFSADGRRLASASTDWTVKVWDGATGREALTLKGHTDIVNAVAFSPDGKRLASASRDGTVKVWEEATGQEALTLKGHTGWVSAVAFSPDGKRLASALSEEPEKVWVKVWEASPVPAAVWGQRELVSRVHALFEELGSREEVLARLFKDTTLSEPDRDFALQVAQTHSEDPQQLNAAAWKVVKAAGLAREAYALALRQAEAAARLAPGDGTILNTLGVAQYRMGRHADAVATLTQSDKFNAARFKSSIPADLAFLAMAQHQLGRKEQAQATLARLREAMKQLQRANDPESQGFLREAEGLIEGRAGGQKP
jgi:Flp pilus assembly protein TadD